MSWLPIALPRWQQVISSGHVRGSSSVSLDVVPKRASKENQLTAFFTTRILNDGARAGLYLSRVLKNI